MLNPNVNPATAETPVPIGYRLESVIFRNHSGREVDLRRIVADFQISESLYTPYLTLSMSIRDSANLLEEMSVSGQETVSIGLARTKLGSGDWQRISLDFWVTEYPVYGRFENRVQTWALRGVTRQALVSQTRRISRAVSGTVPEIVSRILEKDLFVPPEKISRTARASGKVSVIVPNLRPLDAVHWLLAHGSDSGGMPLYCHESLDGTLRIESQSDMVSGPVYRDFRQGLFYTGDPETGSDFEQKQGRILDFSSDLRLSKLVGLAEGAFAGRVTHLDLHSKTFRAQDFSLSGQSVTLEKDPVLSPDWAVLPGEPLAKMSESMVEYRHSDSGNPDNLPGLTDWGELGRLRSAQALLDSMVVDLGLSGDFGLRAGLPVSLTIPRALDPEQKVRGSRLSDGPDQMFSGKYLVTAVVHQFSGDYTQRVRLKRDSFPAGYISG